MASSSVVEGPRALLILDTGPIRELVLYHAIHKFRFGALRPELRFIPHDDAYKICGRFITSFRKRTTSASVVAELHHWVREKGDGRLKLWQRIHEEFLNMGMDEEVVKLVDMDPAVVARFGPVDVSLLEIAKKHSTEDPVLLTVENAMHGECRKAGVGTELLQDVVSAIGL